MLVILQVKGILISISQSGLLPAEGEKLGQLALDLFELRVEYTTWCSGKIL